MRNTIYTLLLMVCWQVAFVNSALAGWDEQAVLARRTSADGFILEKYAYLAQSTYTSGLFFDYNNDGQLDLLILGKGGDWNIHGDVRIVALYKNLGPEQDFRFERVMDTGLLEYADEGYYNPVSAGDYNHDGYTDLLVMTYHDGRHVDLYLNDHGTGHFVRQEDTDFEGATNGSVMFGDLDNDGWLDVEYSGYSNATATALKLYRNQGDGTFSDISQASVTGAFQGASALADINGDGRLDILSTGNGDNWVCLASLYLATADGYAYVGEGQSGLLGASRGTPLVADLNADGRMDIVLNGEPGNGSGFRTRVYYQKENGTFALDTDYPLLPVNADGGINMGDADGDGNMDFIIGGWVGTYEVAPGATYNSPLRVYENHPEVAGIPGNTFPEPPTEVSAVVVGDSLTVTWTEGSDQESAVEALRYNLFVRNDNSGELYTLLPADTHSGRLYVGTDLQTSLSSAIHSYTIKRFGTGDYTVGVQTLDQAYAPSRFAVTTTQGTGVDGANLPSASCYYNMNGQAVVAPQRGVYIKQTGTVVRKVILK